MRVIRTLFVYWLLVFSLLWSYGCSVIEPNIPKDKSSLEDQAGQISPSVTHVEKYFTHTIKWTGENIIRISWWYTGSGKNWLQVIEANPSIDPKRIKIGDSILIPEKLLITNESMPIHYRGPVATQKMEEVEPSGEFLPKTEEVELFGPIDNETQTGLIEENDSLIPLETIE
jgi:hypothetical protein